jgi:hypothetical protein
MFQVSGAPNTVESTHNSLEANNLKEVLETEPNNVIT